MPANRNQSRSPTTTVKKPPDLDITIHHATSDMIDTTTTSEELLKKKNKLAQSDTTKNLNVTTAGMSTGNGGGGNKSVRFLDRSNCLTGSANPKSIDDDDDVNVYERRQEDEEDAMRMENGSGISPASKKRLLTYSNKNYLSNKDNDKSKSLTTSSSSHHNRSSNHNHHHHLTSSDANNRLIRNLINFFRQKKPTTNVITTTNTTTTSSTSTSALNRNNNVLKATDQQQQHEQIASDSENLLPPGAYQKSGSISSASSANTVTYCCYKKKQLSTSNLHHKHTKNTTNLAHYHNNSPSTHHKNCKSDTEQVLDNNTSDMMSTKPVNELAGETQENGGVDDVQTTNITIKNNNNSPSSGANLPLNQLPTSNITLPTTTTTNTLSTSSSSSFKVRDTGGSTNNNNTSLNRKYLLAKTKQIFNKSTTNESSSSSATDLVVNANNTNNSSFDSQQQSVSRQNSSSHHRSSSKKRHQQQQQIEINVTCNEGDSSPPADLSSSKGGSSKLAYFNKKFGQMNNNHSSATNNSNIVKTGSSGNFLLALPGATGATPTSSSSLGLPSGGGNYHGGRRESFLYRSDAESDSFAATKLQRNTTLLTPTNEQHQDELIVTPFAQILASLKNVRQNFISVANLPPGEPAANSTQAQPASAAATPLSTGGGSLGTVSENTLTNAFYGLSSSKKENNPIDSTLNLKDEDSKQKFSAGILEELDWCLNQLEHMQSHKTISDIASTKFKRMLNKELSHFAEHNKSDNQIAEFIYNTYIDQTEDIEIPSVKVENTDATSGGGGSTKTSSTINRSPSYLNLNKSSSQSEAITIVDDPSSIILSAAASAAVRAAAAATSSNNTVDNLCNKQTDDNQLNQSFDNSVSRRTSGEINTSENLNRIESQLSTVSTGSKSSSLVSPLGTSSSTKMNRIISTRNTIRVGGSIASTDSSKNLNDNRYSSPLAVLSKYGIESLNESEELDNLMDSVDIWGLDVFLLDELTNHKPLTALVYNIFQKRDLIDKFSINPVHLINYLTALEDHYQTVPYHNKIHAADVTQSIHVLLGSNALESVFSDLEILAAIFSAAIHDVDHPGLTNQYLINTGSELALMYNDESVLENHHLAVAFKLLQHQSRNIFQNLSKNQHKVSRKMIIDMVLATDMSKHMSLLAELKTMVETKKVAGSGVIELENYQDRIRVLQNMLHCADLSNPTKPLGIYQMWVDRVMSEYFLQGDREASEGLEISPMCDRHNANIEKSQIGFIDFIVHPLWESWADLVSPDAQSILDQLERNRSWYYEQVEKQNAAANAVTNASANTTASTT